MTREQFAVGCVILVAVAAVCLLTGIWWGRGQAREEIAALEADLEEEIAALEADLEAAEDRARRERPQRQRLVPASDEYINHLWDVARERTGYADLGREPVLEPTEVIPPESDTAWTRRMGLELERTVAAMIEGTDAWLREMTR